MILTHTSIRAFQSHDHTEIDLVPGVNVFTGQSDGGKTGILRAIRWVLENRPSGEAFRSHWGGETSVALTWDKKITVQRVKGKGINEYRIFRSSKPEPDEVLMAMGTDVPLQVQELLKFCELNIQHQMDAPFLLNESPGEVARQLNEIADISKIDSSLSAINRMGQKNKESLRTVGQQIFQLKTELDTFKNLDRQQALVKSLKTMEEQAEQMGIISDKIQAMLNTHKKLEESFADLPPLPKVDINSLIALEQEHMALRKQILSFSGKLGNLKSLKSSQTQNEILLNKLEKQWHEQFPEVCPLCEK